MNVQEEGGREGRRVELCEGRNERTQKNLVCEKMDGGKEIKSLLRGQGTR